MAMRESKSNEVLNQYLRETRFYCYYELKVAKGGTFNFKNIEVNQDEGLPALSKNGLVWKLSDEDSRRKPCDGFCTPPLPAFLALKFKKTFYLIPYTEITEMKDGGMKSIDETLAMQCAAKIIHI